MNETLEVMAETVFKSWFVGPTFDGLPKGWQERALYDCAAYISGSAFRNEDFSPERAGLPVIKIGELKDGITSQTKFTEAVLEEKYRIGSGTSFSRGLAVRTHRLIFSFGPAAMAG